jgi:hypothetical protein
MKINDKIIDRILKLMKVKYPSIVDIRYRYINFSHNKDKGLHFFTFYYDIEKIEDMFPEAIVNLEYLKNNEDGSNLPIEAFYGYFNVCDGRLYEYGTNIVKLAEALINSVKRSDEHYTIRFINTNSYYN